MHLFFIIINNTSLCLRQLIVVVSFNSLVVLCCIDLVSSIIFDKNEGGDYAQQELIGAVCCRRVMVTVKEMISLVHACKYVHISRRQFVRFFQVMIVVKFNSFLVRREFVSLFLIELALFSTQLHSTSNSVCNLAKILLRLQQPLLHKARVISRL